MASQTTTTSQHIIDHIGGADNVASLTHCATRLRFQLVDQSKVDVPQLESDPAVLGVVKQGTTGLQVIMGGGVAEYYNGIMREPGMAAAGEKKAAAPAKKEYGGIRGRFGWVDYAFEFLSDTFRPVLWALLGASLIITLLVLADTFHIQDFRMDLHEQPPEFQFAHAMWRSVFYFLPIMVGATAARKLGANEWIGAAIPAALFTPEFMGMKDSAREVATAVEGQSTFVVDFFGPAHVHPGLWRTGLPAHPGGNPAVFPGKGIEEDHPGLGAHGLCALPVPAYPHPVDRTGGWPVWHLYR